MKPLISCARWVAGLLGVFCLLCPSANAGEKTTESYSIGSPVLSDLWVDPVHGADTNSGATREQAVRTLSEAWSRIPADTVFSTTGYRLQLVAGDYPYDDTPQWYEHYYGTETCPVIVNAADGAGTAVLRNILSLSGCRYVYFLGVQVVPGAPMGADAFHLEKSDHILLRQVTINGNGATNREAQEAFKANQCQYVYVEDCDIFGGFDNGLDYVAVQYGHVLRTRLHDAQNWCMYLKGGSANFYLEANELYDANEGGFSAGQGSGFEYMVSPWLHYEAYDIKFVNNIVHDVGGAAFGTNGGYNILLACNTAYRVGANSHVIEVMHGSRVCDGNVSVCTGYLAQGGWGVDVPGGENRQPIPARNVYIFNNLVYNPEGYQSQWQHFYVEGTQLPGPASNIPSPAAVDTNLRIEGNLIWNGTPAMPLGIEEGGNGCEDGNTSCNTAQLLADNTINSVRPELVDPAHGDFRPAEGGSVFSVSAAAVPAFDGGDRPSSPTAPEGDLNNTVSADLSGQARAAGTVPGAYVTGATAVVEGESPVEGESSAASCFGTAPGSPRSNSIVSGDAMTAGLLALVLFGAYRTGRGRHHREGDGTGGVGGGDAMD